MYYTCCIDDRGMTGVKVKPKIVIVTLFFWYLGHTVIDLTDYLPFRSFVSFDVDFTNYLLISKLGKYLRYSGGNGIK